MFSVTTRHLLGATRLAIAGPRRFAKRNKGQRAVFLAIGIGPIAAAAFWSGAAAARLAATSPTPATAVSAAATADPGGSSGDHNVPFGVSVLRGSSTAAGPDKHSGGNSEPFGVTVMRGAPSPPTAPYPCSSGSGIARGFGCVPPAEPYPAEQPSEDVGYSPYENYGWPFFGSTAFPHRAFRHRFVHRRSIVAPRSAFRHHKFRFARGSRGFVWHGHH